MRNYIGIDIGGTSMVAARFSDTEILVRSEVSTGAERPADDILRIYR